MRHIIAWAFGLPLIKILFGHSYIARIVWPTFIGPRVRCYGHDFFLLPNGRTTTGSYHKWYPLNKKARQYFQ